MEKSLQNENLSINVNSFGGALSSIKDKDGLEYLWQGDKKYWSKEIVYSIESNEELLAQYPYNFKLSISYTLSGKSIIITYKVENRSDEVMPFFLGAHPGFNCPLTEDTAYEDYYVEFDHKENCTSAKP